MFDSNRLFFLQSPEILERHLLALGNKAAAAYCHCPTTTDEDRQRLYEAAMEKEAAARDAI